MRRAAVVVGLLVGAGLLAGCGGQGAPAAGPSAGGGRLGSAAGMSASALPATGVPAVPAAAVVSASGPTPSSWQGGHAVAVAPRWWPRGVGYPSAAWLAAWPKPVAFSPTARGRLSGLVIALDPGHDAGNFTHSTAINRTYWVGLWKTCNTTGTATNSGYREASYTFDVVARLRRLLVAQGATVVITRDGNVSSTYGPCVGARGAFGKQEHAALMVSVHGDGGPSSGRGFHVIEPAYYKGYTDDIYSGSRALGSAMVSGMTSVGLHRTTYLSSVISVRKDQGTLNTSGVPTVIVETLNMRNASDARIATTTTGRQLVARGLFAGIVRYLHR